MFARMRMDSFYFRSLPGGIRRGRCAGPLCAEGRFPKGAGRQAAGLCLRPDQVRYLPCSTARKLSASNLTRRK